MPLKDTDVVVSPVSAPAWPSVGVFVYVPVFAPALSAAFVPAPSFSFQ